MVAHADCALELEVHCPLPLLLWERWGDVGTMGLVVAVVDMMCCRVL